MDKKTCVNCGEVYSAELEKCPVCGEKYKETTSLKNSSPYWLKTAILIFTGVAVIAAAILVVLNMGIIPANEAAPSQSLDISASPTASQSLAVIGTGEPQTSSTPAQSSPQVSAAVSGALAETGVTASPGVEETGAAESSAPATTAPVSNVKVNSIDISRTDISFFSKNETCSLNVSADPTTASQYVVWSSSDSKIAEVDENGKVTAVSGGVAYITATIGEKTATCIVRCNMDTSDEMLVMSSEDITLFYVGETTALSIEDITDTQKAKVVWTSSDTKIATVDKSGNITAVAGGTAKITATLDKKTATCVVRVDISSVQSGGKTYSITLNKNDVTLFATGEYVQLNVETQATIDAATIAWTSDNSKVATVDSTGKVKAVGEGTTTITATIDGQTLKCIVRVSFKD